MSETTLRAGTGWGATTVDFGVNYNVNVGRGEGGVSDLSMVFGAGIVRLISVAICFIEFCVSYPNESEGTLGFGCTKKEIISLIYFQR